MTPESVLDWIVSRVRSVGIEGLFGRFYGIYPSLVEDVDDPDKVGRVRVRVLALGQRRAPPSTWAMPGVFGGSAGTGVFFPPSVGDVVWVQFVAGDPNKPVYMGGFLGTGKGIPELDESFKRGLKTPAGHWVRFSDEPGDEHVTVTSSSGASVTLDSAGGFTVEAGSASVSVEASGSVTVTASNVTVDAASVKLGAGASLGVFTSAFAAIFNSHTHVCAAPGSPTLPPLPLAVVGAHTTTAVKAS